MMSDSLRREVAGIALLLLAVFLIGAFLFHSVPPDLSCLETRGVFGPVGGCLKSGLFAFLGAPAAWLSPLIPLIYGLRLLGRAHAEGDRRWLLFLLGALIILPLAVGLAEGAATRSGSLAGLWGGFTAFYAKRALGAAGAWFLVVLLISALMALTLRWNPVRAIVGPTPVGARAAAIDPSALVAREPAPEEMPAIEGYAGVATAPAESGKKRPAKARVVTAEPEEEVDDEEDPEEVEEDEEDEDEDEIPVLLAPGDLALEDVLPSPELLTPPPEEEIDAGLRELDAMGRKLMDALHTFKVDGQLVGRTVGPVVTQFEIEPAPGVKVRQFANLANDLALAMRAQSVRIVAPIPGRGAVGVEVPNPTAQLVAFRELIEAPEFQNARMALPLALGRDLEGKVVVADLARMPHLLIAGATGSGKSVCINTIITSLAYRHTAATLKFLMVDPKMVELSAYNALPHLLHKVITDNRDAAYVLKWAVIEMQRRYELLAANGARNIQEFNKRVVDGASLMLPRRPEVAFERQTYDDGILPYVVLVIDELADLMMTVQAEVETPLAMLAQKARAIGIHIILATQRPSVNVITGLIKANFPSRIAFRVASQIDSRTILDGVGAEALLGNGDMLFLPPGRSDPQRLQGAYIPGEDTERLTQWFVARHEARLDALAAKGLPVGSAERDIVAEVKQQEESDMDDGDDAEGTPGGERDVLFRRAAETCIQHQLGSTSLLQRRLGIGYGRAARIIDQLHAAGVLGPPNGSKPREILVGLDQIPD